MRHHTIAAIALSGLAALSGCASSGLSDADRLATYEAAAGAPVASFSYFGNVSSWMPVGERHIAVWTRPSEGWLLGFDGRCPDIDVAPVISLTSQGKRVSAGFDRVMVHNRNAMQIPCRIREIRPLDATRLREEEKAARARAQDASSGT